MSGTCAIGTVAAAAEISIRVYLVMYICVHVKASAQVAAAPEISIQELYRCMHIHVYGLASARIVAVPEIGMQVYIFIDSCVYKQASA